MENYFRFKSLVKLSQGKNEVFFLLQRCVFLYKTCDAEGGQNGLCRKVYIHTCQEEGICSERDEPAFQAGHERVLYFHDAFEKKNAVIIITELYPYYAVRTKSTVLQSAQLAFESK